MRQSPATPVSGRSVVEQYAGRLNRDYEGKTHVLIYDYIDIHIPVFDRMYSKRLKAYRQIGYELSEKTGKNETMDSPGFIFDTESYLEPYFDDLRNAKKEIIICSPGLRAGKIRKIMEVLKPLQERGVKVTVLTWKMDFDRHESSEARAYLIEELRRSGVYLMLSEDVNEHFTVIDRETIWYGSLNFLGKEDVSDNIMRFTSQTAAEELLEIACMDE